MFATTRARPDTQTSFKPMRERARAEHSLDGVRASVLRSGRRGGGAQKEVACAEALKNAPKVKAGMKRSEVLDLLGPPTDRSGERWGYNFWPCTRRPRAAEQLIIGLEIMFREGAVREIKWATVDATGPGSAAVTDTALESFWKEFQSAVEKNDKEGVASMTRFPLSMAFRHEEYQVQSAIDEELREDFQRADAGVLRRG